MDIMQNKIFQFWASIFFFLVFPFLVAIFYLSSLVIFQAWDISFIIMEGRQHQHDCNTEALQMDMSLA